MPARAGDSFGQRIALSPWSDAMSVSMPTGVECVVLCNIAFTCIMMPPAYR
jgi:hypothetical protein